MERPFRHPLDRLPSQAILRAVTATPAHIGGEQCLRVELEDDVTRTGVPFVDYIDQATFVELPVEMTTGRVEVDVMARLNGKTDFDARGFAGVAYRVNAGSFEAIYVRTLNGARTDAPPQRKERGIQYFAHPDWLFDRLRQEHPGEYERSADVLPGEWFTLSIEVEETTVTASIDGEEALAIHRPKAPPRRGRVGLFVDIGTEAHFRNLRMIARS